MSARTLTPDVSVHIRWTRLCWMRLMPNCAAGLDALSTGRSLVGRVRYFRACFWREGFRPKTVRAQLPEFNHLRSMRAVHWSLHWGAKIANGWKHLFARFAAVRLCPVSGRNFGNHDCITTDWRRPGNEARRKLV